MRSPTSNTDLNRRSTRDSLLPEPRLQSSRPLWGNNIAVNGIGPCPRPQVGGCQNQSLITAKEVKTWGLSGFVGRSEAFGEIVAAIRRLQSFESTSVLITGESGTGKELIARAIHFGGSHRPGPFIPVNCVLPASVDDVSRAAEVASLQT